MTSNAKWRWVAFGGLGVMLLGSVLPWAKVSAGILSVTQNGTEGDGLLTLVLAIIGIVFFGLLKNGRNRAIILLIVAGLAGAIAIYDIINFTLKAASVERSEGIVSASVEFGLWLTAFGAVAATVAAIALIAGSRGGDSKPAPERG